MRRIKTAACTSAIALAAAIPIPASADIVIGYLADMTGATSNLSGASALHAVNMAVADFGGAVNGENIVVLSADHRNNPDNGLSIAREWLDTRNINALIGVDNSAVALAVNSLVSGQNVTVMAGASNSRLINELCSPTQSIMLLTNSALARAVLLPQVEQGDTSWFFITVNYAFGIDLQALAANTIETAGGSVVGGITHSPETTDFSAFLLQAQASGATNIALATFGTWQNTIARQAQEFGIEAALSPFYLGITDVQSAGLDTLQNVTGSITFYWDQNDATREFAARFAEGYGRPPTFTNAFNYEFTRHYLRGVEATGSADAIAVNAWMRENPMELINGSTAQIRADGYTLRDVYAYRTKTPQESSGEWDYLEILGTVAAEAIAPPLEDSTCSLVQG
jgi:branched-chain amino acid transport system substrate-binding protein